MNNMTGLISWFQLEYPELVAEMRFSNHHLERYDVDEYNIFDEAYAVNINPYHLEGDVFTHTMMVCKQAENASYEVKIAALLHDIGKPSTRAVNPKNGRVSFYNHDAVSAFMSLEILKREELGLSKEQQSHIFNLIALHTQIYKLSVEQLAAIGNRELVSDLIELGKVDHAGRFHTAGDAVIPSIEDIPFRDKEELEFEKEVVVLVGLPGSGKSKYSEDEIINTMVVEENDDIWRVSRDHLIHLNVEGKGYNEKWKNADQKKIDKLLQDSFNHAVFEGYSQVIVDMTHMSKKSRRRTLSHFDKSYKRKAVVFLTDLVTNDLRNSQREGKTIDNSVIQKMMRSFYPPCFSEFDEIEYVL
jgi:putative nucleotidyltransferase with HDIG domain